MYIGRTTAYYGDEDDSVYTPDYWTYSEDPNDKEFAGDIYALNSDGISELQWWIHSQQMNDYQSGNSFNPNTKSPEKMWAYLTNPQNNLSQRIS